MAKTSFYTSSGATSTETDAIEGSVNAAAASQAAAATSETNAAASATSAASSASSASSSSSSATTAKTASETAKTASETAKTASEAARDLALTYRNAAQTASATATTKSDEASTSATNAANSATAAASSASAASSSQSAAASSATSAANSAAGLTDEAIQDKVGAMFSSNTETGITMTYQDSDGTIDAVVDTSSLTETLTNKTLTSPVLNTGVSGTAIKDEDNMSSNSATHLATQQSIKAYVDDVAQTTEEVQDIVGAMFSSNTETGITVTYEDSDGTIDLVVGTLNQDTTGTAALATEITVSANNSSDETVYPLFVDGATGSQGAESDTGLNYNPSSGILTATQFTGNLLGNVTGNVSGSSGSTTGNAATSTVATNVVVTDNESGNNNCAITFVNDLDGSTSIGLQSDGNLFYNPSTGTLTVENISVSGTQTIVDSVTMNASNQVVFEGSTANAHETFLTSIDATGDRTISLPDVSGTLPVLAAVSSTQITSTPEELNILDGVTSTTAELNILDGVTSTASELNLLDGSSANTVVNSKAVIYGSGGELAGTLSTAAQPSITSVGTLTALTGGTGDFNWDSNTLVVDSSVNRVGILNAAPDVTLDIGSANDAIHVPVGTTAQRPASPAAGYFRYNSTTGDFEGYTDSWGAIAGSGGTAPVVNTMSGDGSDDTLSLTSAPVNENATVVTVDGVLQHKDTYSVSGTTLTFSEAPPNGSAVECITWVNTQITSALLLADADSDTKIQVEESSDEDKIRFDTGGTERMVLDSGSLTVTPKIVSDAGVDIDNFNIDGTTIALSSGDMTLDSAGDIILDADGGDLIFKDAGTEVGRFSNTASDLVMGSAGDIVFDPDGNDLVFNAGQSSTFTFFTDSGSNQGDTGLIFRTDGSSANQKIATIYAQQGSGDGASQKGEMVFQVADNGNPATALTISNNKVINTASTFLVGTTNTSQAAGAGVKLDNESSYGRCFLVGSGSSGEGFSMYDGSAYKFYVTYGGVINATTTTVSGISDERLKENIKDLDQGLSDVLKLKPRKFDWKEGEGTGEKNVSGFVAQEAETAGFGEFVGDWKHDTLSDAKSFGQGGLIPVLTKAIQELSAKNDALEARIKTLEDA